MRGMDNGQVPRFFVSYVEPRLIQERVDMNTLSNVSSPEVVQRPQRERETSFISPELKSTNEGVSVRYAHDSEKSWFVLRASFGREEKAFEYIMDDGTYAYIARQYVMKVMNGKRKKMVRNMIPNILFVYTSDAKVREYVNNTPALPFLSFYYNHFKRQGDNTNPPLTIPTKEMENFILATSTMDMNLLWVEPSRCHYKGGEKVRVTSGLFKGVEGRVARVAGQQRVVVTLPYVGLFSTAYIPTAFIEVIGDSL